MDNMVSVCCGAKVRVAHEGDPAIFTCNECRQMTTPVDSADRANLIERGFAAGIEAAAKFLEKRGSPNADRIRALRPEKP